MTHTQRQSKRRGFTLVEMLVVITIISILASLVLVGANAARKAARRAAIKLEIDNLAGAFQEYEKKYGSFPPNTVTTAISSVAPSPADRQKLMRDDLLRHFNQAFGKHQEPPALFDALVGASNGGGLPVLAGGMSPTEAIFFFLGGFSSDVRFPISGKGGPAFDPSNPLGEDVEGRQRIFEFDYARLGPRKDDNTFGGRVIQYTVQGQVRRIHLWTYHPRGFNQNYVYFNTSLYKPAQYDPIYAPGSPPGATQVVPLKTASASGTGVQFANPKSFQILHAGIDDAWGGPELWGRLSITQIASGNGILYPTGPFTGELADTLVNFSPQQLEDAE